MRDIAEQLAHLTLETKLGEYAKPNFWYIDPHGVRWRVFYSSAIAGRWLSVPDNTLENRNLWRLVSGGARAITATHYTSTLLAHLDHIDNAARIRNRRK